MIETQTRKGLERPAGGFGDLQKTVSDVVSSPAFLPGLTVGLFIFFAFYNLFRFLPSLYLDGDGYYSHGLFMPFTAAYVVHRNWALIKSRPVKGSSWALIPLALILVILRPSSIANMDAFMSFLLVGAMLSGVWFVAGWKWMLSVSLPILSLLLGLPVWSMAINSYTNPLQLISTQVAFWMLSVVGMSPFRDGTIIHLNHFNLDVGVPCSGLKLIVALSAFTCFFMMIARLRWFCNVFLVALIIPMALFFNGLRIAMIGFVGETWGDEAGHQFHDYSGYIMLGVCFLTFFQIVRWLGWKD